MLNEFSSAFISFLYSLLDVVGFQVLHIICCIQNQVYDHNIHNIFQLSVCCYLILLLRFQLTQVVTFHSAVRCCTAQSEMFIAPLRLPLVQIGLPISPALYGRKRMDVQQTMNSSISHGYIAERNVNFADSGCYPSLIAQSANNSLTYYIGGEQSSFPNESCIIMSSMSVLVVIFLYCLCFLP